MRYIGIFAVIVFTLLPAASLAASPSSSTAPTHRARGPALTVGRPIARGNLAVFPVYSPARREMPSGYLTLDEALQRHLILAKEMPDAEVNRVSVTSSPSGIIDFSETCTSSTSDLLMTFCASFSPRRLIV